ncbi:hypothetical protein DWG14_00362 [Streptomyces griseorubiginosus]|uniref:Uncharacterized protein n=1 Tax=Streptomyces griseorubiginosus TaxID=67304 RepID=A0AAI8PKH5_9ACTN|nr:hypothetical protein DWG14_00362 [Streptomyces griseorubiginosus]
MLPLPLPLPLPLLVAAFFAVHRAYGRIGERLGLGRFSEPPHRRRSLVIVPVSSLSRVTSEALTTAASLGASMGRPIAAYVREVAAAEPFTRVTVLIPEAEPERLWQRLLQNQRGAVVAHAVRRETDAVICRLRFRLL